MHFRLVGFMNNKNKYYLAFGKLRNGTKKASGISP